MPNASTNFWQTVIAAASEAAQLLAPNWRMIESIYMDYKPQAATFGETLNIVIPSDPSQNVVDQGIGNTVLSPVASTVKSITFNNHPSFDYAIPDFAQFNSTVDVRRFFLDAALKSVKNYVNNKVCALVNSTNLSTNASISTTAHIITTAQALSGLTVLSDQFVPVTDNAEDMSLIVPSQVYFAIVGDNQWTEALIAGERTAEIVRSTGRMPTAYGLTVKLDQQLPTTGAVGSRTYSSVLMHRHSIALATRPLPNPETPVVEVMTLDFAGIPVRIMLGYNQYPVKGWVTSVECGFGLSIIRDNMAQLYSTAE